MKSKRKDLGLVGFFAALLIALTLFAWLKPHTDYSEAERRVLASRPEISLESLLSGKFMKDFELYTQDQFPLRESFRSLKSMSLFYGMGRRDSNGLYMADGHVSKLDYPLNQSMAEHAAQRFEFVYEKYLKESGSELYMAIVPDKNYYLAEENGYPAMDYEKLISYMRESCSYFEYIDLFPLLSAEDYYRTDSHWRQERILPVADKLMSAMGVEAAGDYQVNTLPYPFKGVYCGQIALPLEPDGISYLTSPVLSGCSVTSYNTGKPLPSALYDMEKAQGRDAYEMFLSGNDALIVIENPAAETSRELIVFRDSFGSSLAPLLAEAYSKITLVDLRYINSAMLSAFIDFEDKDVLFLYSTMLLNNSLAIK